jgi:hypothetical protein
VDELLAELGDDQVADQRQLAEHEAAHTVMRYVYGRQTPGCRSRFRYVTIVKADDAAGHLAGIGVSWMDDGTFEAIRDETVERQDAGTRRRIEHDIMVALAGAEWDDMHGRSDADDVDSVHGHDIYVGRVRNDLRNAYDMASLGAHSDATATAYVGWLAARTRDFLALPLVSPLVGAVADALMEVGTLSYADVKRVIADSQPTTRAVFDGE